MSRTALIVLILALTLAACTGGTDSGPGGQIAVEVKPLQLDGVGDVEFAIAVYNAEGDLVWDEPSLLTSIYGAAGVGLAYVGPCDATPLVPGTPAMNTVHLIVKSLRTADGTPIPTDTWVNPAPDVPVTSPAALTLSVACRENEDSPVVFDLTIVRDALQGFFDIAVDFEDIFCSGKLDCKDGDGPLELLHHPTRGEREATAVMAFACAAGDGQDVALYLSAIDISCKAGATTTFSKSFPPAALLQGNQGGVAPAIFQVGHYWGKEGFDFDKCYWNHAFGLDLTAMATLGTCTIEAWGTASHESWLDLSTPEHAVYPVIHWSAELTDDGVVTCTHHPIGSTEVAIEYTDPDAPVGFASIYECGEDPIGTEQEIVCAGDEGAVAALDADGHLTVTVMVGAVPVSTSLDVPAGTRIRGNCCLHECCQ